MVVECTECNAHLVTQQPLLLQHRGAHMVVLDLTHLSIIRGNMSETLNQWLSGTCVKYLGNALIVIQCLNLILEQIGINMWFAKLSCITIWGDR